MNVRENIDGAPEGIKAKYLGAADLEKALRDALELVAERAGFDQVRIYHPSQIKVAVRLGEMTEAEADELFPEWRTR